MVPLFGRQASVKRLNDTPDVGGVVSAGRWQPVGLLGKGSDGLANRELRLVEDDHLVVGPLRVLVIDDEACRAALAEVVSAGEQFTLAGCADSGQEALQLLPRLDPDLVLLDVRMPGLDGPETARLLLKRQPEAVVVLVSADPDLESLAASCGATAFLPKSKVSPRRLSEIWAETRARAAKARREAHALQEEARGR
jgi:CheY-like chemotaxis protein